MSVVRRGRAAALAVAVALLSALLVSPMSSADAATAYVEGRVVDKNGDPVAGVRVLLSYIYDNPYEEDDEAEVTTTGADGRYAFDGIEDFGSLRAAGALSAATPGHYRVEFSKKGYAHQYWQGASQLGDATDVVIGTEQAHHIDVTLVPDATITGRLTDPDGTPLDQAYGSVWRHDPDGKWRPVHDHGGVYSVPGHDGYYTVEGLGAGTYRLGLYSSNDYLDEFWNDSPTVEGAQDITVTEGEDVTGKDAQLARASSISGTVTNDQGAPIDNRNVRLVDPDHPTATVASADTNSAGHYELKGVPPGSYRIELSSYSYPEPYARQFWDNAKTLEEATPVEVGADESVHLDMTMARLTTNLSPPIIQGTPKVGVPLHADPGSWTNPEDVQFIYRWKMDGRQLNNGEEQDYTPSTGTVGHRITVTVRAYGRDAGIDLTSAKSAVVLPGTIQAATLPALSGRVFVGSRIYVSRGAWIPGVTASYSWLRNGTAISGAHYTSYVLTSSDWGKTVTAKVTARRTGYTTTSRSVSTDTVKRASSIKATATPLGGGKVRFTAKVSVVGTSRPSGTVAVTENHVPLGTSPKLVNGTVTFTISGLVPGKHTYTLRYSGNSLVLARSVDVTTTVR